MKGFCVLRNLNTLFMNQECRRKQSEYSNLNKQCHEARVLKNTNRLYLNEYSQTTSAISQKLNALLLMLWSGLLLLLLLL